MKVRIAAGLVVLLCLVAAVTQPWAAASPHHSSKIVVSRNGHHWSTTLHMPLFKKRVVLVPGSAEIRRFFVKNRGGETARLTVSVHVKDRSRLLNKRRFRMRVRTADHFALRAVHPGWHRLGHAILAKGEVVPVTVKVRLFRTAGNRIMNRHLRFVVRVRLTQHTSPQGDKS